MDLRGNRITLGELLQNPRAKQLAQREFAGLMNPMMLSMAKNMTLQQALGYAQKRISQQEIERILEELRKL